MTPLFDTHAHLCDAAFDKDREALLMDLPKRGIGLLMEAAVSLDSIRLVKALIERVPYIYGAAGVHPDASAAFDTAALDGVAQALKEPKFVALGEIGLDYHYDDMAPRELQRACFAEQLDLACQLCLPVIVHDREAHADCLSLLEARRGRLRGVMHCYSGSYETACRLIELGFYIGFGGALTFKNAVHQRDVASRLPLERLVIETDCPYMTPVPYRGKRNDPSYLSCTRDVLASIRGLDADELGAILTENGKRLYGLA